MTRSFVADEITSQPDLWRAAAALAGTGGRPADGLPHHGERVALVGCGTSWFVGMSAAVVREQAGHGITDAFAGSEFPRGRDYDRVVAISRSGTTTEIVDLLRGLTVPTTVITTDENSPAAHAADAVLTMPFADEQSVVQTRFATCALSLLRAAAGHDIDAVAADGTRALEVDVTALAEAEQCTFIAQGWSVGLASEAALKAREAAQLWTESYPAMDYRHGPVAIAEPGRLVWSIGPEPEGLADEVARTGATFVRQADLDPQAALVVAQRFAVAAAERRGLDPDRPRSLTRAVILT